MRWKLALAVVVAGAVASGGAMAAEIAVTIKGMKFTPATVTVHVGDTIVWTNEDAMPHTATARSKDFDLAVPAGKSASLTVTKAGAFDYFCKIHPSMTAKLTAE